MKILSFDIEEWFHLLANPSTKTEAEWANYESRIHQNMDIIFKLLEEGKQKATFFCVGWVARKYPDVIKRIVESGYEVGSHTYYHQLVYEQNPEVFHSDIADSIKILEDLSGQKVKYFRAPGFSITEENLWAFDVLLANGIELDSSVFPAGRAHGGFKSFGAAKPVWIERNGMLLKEMPINSHDFLGQNLIFSGGGYFRFFPSRLLNRFFKESEYVMTYFHPRDFDINQPIIKDLNYMRRFKSYYGLSSTYPKLKNLLKNNDFVDIKVANSLVDWDSADIIHV